jgi:hypothetical protein
MNKWLKITSGLAVLIIAIYLILPGMPLSSWGYATLELVKGGITVAVILMGIVLIIIGMSELKN